METAELDVEQRTGAEAVEAESADELNVRDLEGKYQRAELTTLTRWRIEPTSSPLALNIPWPGISETKF